MVPSYDSRPIRLTRSWLALNAVFLLISLLLSEIPSLPDRVSALYIAFMITEVTTLLLLVFYQHERKGRRELTEFLCTVKDTFVTEERVNRRLTELAMHFELARKDAEAQFIHYKIDLGKTNMDKAYASFQREKCVAEQLGYTTKKSINDYLPASATPDSAQAIEPNKREPFQRPHEQTHPNNEY